MGISLNYRHQEPIKEMKTYNNCIQLEHDLEDVLNGRPDLHEEKDRILDAVDTLFRQGKDGHVYTLKTHPKYFDKSDVYFDGSNEHHLMGILLPVGATGIGGEYSFQVAFDTSQYNTGHAANFPFLTIKCRTANGGDIIANWDDTALYDFSEQVTWEKSMPFSITKVNVTAKTRALGASYSHQSLGRAIRIPFVPIHNTNGDPE